MRTRYNKVTKSWGIWNGTTWIASKDNQSSFTQKQEAQRAIKELNASQS